MGMADPLVFDVFGRFSLLFFSFAWVIVCFTDARRRGSGTLPATSMPRVRPAAHEVSGRAAAASFAHAQRVVPAASAVREVSGHVAADAHAPGMVQGASAAQEEVAR